MSLNNEKINAAFARLIEASNRTESLGRAKANAEAEVESLEKTLNEALIYEQVLLAEYSAIKAGVAAEYEALVAAYSVAAKSSLDGVHPEGLDKLADALAPSLSGARHCQAWEEAVRRQYQAWAEAVRQSVCPKK